MQHVSGNAGIDRMDSALSDTRSKFFDTKDNGTPVEGPVARVASLSSSNSSVQSLPSVLEEHAFGNSERSKHVIRSLFGERTSSSPPKAGLKSQAVGAQSGNAHGKRQPTENEILVNEIVHGDQITPIDKEANIKVGRLLESILAIIIPSSFLSK